MDGETPESAALSVMRDHLRALNARDEDAVARTLHFPHVRLTEGRLKIWQTPDSYLTDFRMRAGKDWHRSEWGAIEVIRAGPDKVHLDVEVRRYAVDGRLVAAFHSLWVIALIDGRWAAQLRSSFARDTVLAGS